jgi:hypothetical protein
MQRRCTKAYLPFLHKKGCPPPEDWYGDGGTKAITIKAIAMSADDRRKVMQVITETYHCLRCDKVYDKGRALQNNVATIVDGSKIQQLIANFREAGLSFSQMTLMINMYCNKNNLRTVTLSAIISCKKRMKRMVVPVTKCPQGSLEKMSNWAQACFGWVTQLQIRFGINVCLNPFLEESTGLAVPPWFDKEQLSPLNKFAIGWWDKTHKECRIGAYLGEQVLYTRNEDGTYDGTSDSFHDPQVSLQVNYPKETRLLLGVACVKNSNGKEHGVCLDLFDYTEKKIISVKDTKKIIDTEITRVRAMQKKTKGRFLDSHENGRIDADDSVIRVKGVGKKDEGLLQRNGINTVANLRALIKETRPDGLTVKAIKQYLANCEDASSENASSITYFTEADNPFAARYGEEEDEWGQPEWISNIKGSTVFGHQVCIIDLVKHIVVLTKKCYQDTEHSNTYMFYHKALSLMTAKLCVEWMKQQKIPGEETVVYDRWIQPELGLNNHISTFGGRPPGGIALS